MNLVTVTRDIAWWIIAAVVNKLVRHLNVDKFSFF